MLARLPDILNLTHERARQATYDFLVNQRSARTKEHYLRIVMQFLAWAEARELKSLAELTTADIKNYVEGLIRRKGSGFARVSAQSRAQVISCLRGYFNDLVLKGALAFNPVTSVKNPKTKANEGAFPPLPDNQVVRLLDGIGEATLQDVQDRAVIGLMVFACARVSAVTKLKQTDVWEELGRIHVRLEEKGGKPHQLPLNREAERYLRAFLAKSSEGSAGCDPNPEGWLFRRWNKRRRVLTSLPLDRLVCYRMVRRRAKSLGIVHRKMGNHTFRATGITMFINAGGVLEDARRLANHSSTNTTRLYDHNRHGVKECDVDRIDYRRNKRASAPKED
ncbi:MAG: tyrosine-type recombinase/integrase [Proteobacteria bacterium]|nr:tyrosine-type recombinase/integrase [Pseudomonadota bacterium]